MPDTAMTAGGLPGDSDGELRVPRQRDELRRAPWVVLAVISLGGGLGGLARYGLAEVWPAAEAGFAWATLVTNVSGCLLIGVLMVLVAAVWPGRWLLRPFLGVGALGGFTTFATYVVDIGRLVAAGAIGAALLYAAATMLAALAATWIAVAVTRRLVGRQTVNLPGPAVRLTIFP